ncbi:Cyclase family protein [Striga hermonthica]|uniref:Cyclase family protein n=1 Tax=Striga hermonthica TaxID=68872 RepID=A0A9N7R2P7_STRHE|nr:Cyclase family protein [Striga hermonthica]
MISALLPLLLICAAAHGVFMYAMPNPDAAYPPPYGHDESCTTSAAANDRLPPRRDIRGTGRILDITHRVHKDLPSWDSEDGLGRYVWLAKSMKNGSLANNSEMKLGAHTGTHVDAPGHVYDHYFDSGFDVDTLDLEVLNGPALLVDVPRDKNITAEVMESLNIPKGVKRVLFRTLNTDRGLMYKTAFDTSYVGFMKDGAQWLVDNTDIKLVGIDYLSVAAYDDLIPSHLVLLKSKEIILVEGLKLDKVPVGLYNLHCLPLRLVGSEGSPIRCILIKWHSDFSIIVEATPPGIAKNPSHARCLIKKYKHCYNLEHVCPKYCPDSCSVECVSCKPICGGVSTIPTPDSESPSPPEGSPGIGSDDSKGDDNGKGGGKGDDDNGEGNGKGGGEGDDNNNGKGHRKGGGKGDDDNGKGHGKGGGDDRNETPPTQTPVPPQSPPAPVPDSPLNSPPSIPVTPPPSSPTPTPVPPQSPPAPVPDSPPNSPPSIPVTPPLSPPTPTPAPPQSPPTPISDSPPFSPPSIPVTPPPSPSTPTPVPPQSPPALMSDSPPNSPPSIPITPPQTPPPSTPTNSPPTPSTPTPPSPVTRPPPADVPTPPTDLSEAAGGRRKRCRNRNYPHCYGVQHVCPAYCPRTCEIDCVTCRPVCQCDMPGAVCQDPRFIGGDGITFYFHGKKGRDFCLVNQPNLHINAHFIGRRNENMKRDFTWVQSIGILFGPHRLLVGTQKTAIWNDAVDRLSLAFDGEPIALPTAEGFKWKATNLPSANISANVVPITKHESKVHNYRITDDDCFAHLELGFKFFSLSENVNGVLGQTYGKNYVSRVEMGVPMPVLGGKREFAVSNLFAADCEVSQFQSGEMQLGSVLELPAINCSSGVDGKGVVCKR